MSRARAPDGQTTQKISREQLDEALKRTKSGTRRAVRSDPALDLPAPEEIDRDAFFGPRDDTAPMLAHIDPSSLNAVPAAAALPLAEDTPAVVEVAPVVEVRAAPSEAKDKALRIPPRTAFILGVACAVLVVLAALVGFFAGRTPHR